MPVKEYHSACEWKPLSISDPVNVRRPAGVPLGIDSTDRRLLLALRANGRSTYAELGRLVGLSAPAVHDRVGKLEAAGHVTGYHAEVAPSALGLGVSALVGIFTREGVEQDVVAERLREVPPIEDCWAVAGEETFIVKVRAPDVDALESILGTLRRIRGVARTRTTVVLSTPWEGRVPFAPEPDTAPE